MKRCRYKDDDDDYVDLVNDYVDCGILTHHRV